MKNYPSLTSSEFNSACERFEERCADTLEGTGWVSVQFRRRSGLALFGIGGSPVGKHSGAVRDCLVRGQVARGEFGGATREETCEGVAGELGELRILVRREVLIKDEGKDGAGERESEEGRANGRQRGRIDGVVHQGRYHDCNQDVDVDDRATSEELMNDTAHADVEKLTDEEDGDEVSVCPSHLGPASAFYSDYMLADTFAARMAYQRLEIFNRHLFFHHALADILRSCSVVLLA
jgi:hypothetical protein